MDKEQAIIWANKRPRNINLQWHVVEYGEKYCVITGEALGRHPNCFSVVYSTNGMNHISLEA